MPQTRELEKEVKLDMPYHSPLTKRPKPAYAQSLRDHDAIHKRAKLCRVSCRPPNGRKTTCGLWGLLSSRHTLTA
jgi:hypothetical protein